MSLAKNKPKREDSLGLSKLKELGLFTLLQAKEAGFSQSKISRLLKTNRIEKVGHGYYLHPDSDLPREELDYILASKRLGKQSVVSGLTALFFHGLIHQVPVQIWVVVPKIKQVLLSDYRLIRANQVKPKIGVLPNKNYQMATVERAILESLKYSTKVGVSLAVEATMRAIREKKTNFRKLAEMAKSLGLTKVLEKYSDAILATEETLE